MDSKGIKAADEHADKNNAIEAAKKAKRDAEAKAKKEVEDQLKREQVGGGCYSLFSLVSFSHIRTLALLSLVSYIHL